MFANYKHDKSNSCGGDYNPVYIISKHDKSYNYMYCNGDDDCYQLCCEHEDLSITESCFDEGVD